MLHDPLSGCHNPPATPQAAPRPEPLHHMGLTKQGSQSGLASAHLGQQSSDDLPERQQSTHADEVGNTALQAGLWGRGSPHHLPDLQQPANAGEVVVLALQAVI